jgi:hypothetical protein
MTLEEDMKSGTVNLKIGLFSGYSTGKMLKPLIICRNRQRSCTSSMSVFVPWLSGMNWKGREEGEDPGKDGKRK